MKRLLCVFAHPDDECLGPGGTIAQCALDGGEVFIITFTAGEAGSIGISKTLTREELGKRRRKEMEAAAAALGVAGHRILGVPDKGVSNVDPAWAVGEIVADIRRCRPQVVLTFHRAGVSGHPDHIAVAQFLDRACVATNDDGPLRSFGWGISVDRARLYERPNLVPVPDEEIAASITIGTEAMDRKIAAIQAHETQIEFFQGLEARFDYRALASPEHFALARSRTAPAGKILTDLWEGIDV
jgi:LmbE family N-acetylglucosaminyl deacetylase